MSSVHDQIGDLKSEIGPTPCDKKCCSEHQTLFTRVECLGMRLIIFASHKCMHSPTVIMNVFSRLLLGPNRLDAPTVTVQRVSAG